MYVLYRYPSLRVFNNRAAFIRDLPLNRGLLYLILFMIISNLNKSRLIL